jgi:hypothetical protein
VNIDSGLFDTLQQLSQFLGQSQSELTTKALKLLLSDPLLIKINAEQEIKLKIEVKE